MFDPSDAGIGTFEGVEAIRGFFEDWWASWGSHDAEAEEIVDLGHGVVFALVRERGRPVGSDGQVEQRGGWVVLWVRGAIERQTGYLDIDEGRAAAERLAQERADG